MTMTEIPEVTHPRIRERLTEVQDASVRSRNRKFKAIAIVVGLAALVAAATQSRLLDVDEVHVVGALRTNPETIRDVAAIPLGTPLLGFDHGSVEDRVRTLPEIIEASSSSNWRGVVSIEVAERVPVARIEAPEGTIVVAADGVVLSVVSAERIPGPDDPGFRVAETDPVVSEVPADVASLPAISGVMFSTTPGALVPRELGEALLVAEQLPSDVARVTERIEITVDSLVLRFVGGGSVALGDARDLGAKFDAVRAFLEQVDLSCLDELNVRAPRVPVIIRSDNCT